ncbi:hypothetical protein JCM3770_003279 [Rhodotorula araucariae]
MSSSADGVARLACMLSALLRRTTVHTVPLLRPSLSARTLMSPPAFQSTESLWPLGAPASAGSAAEHSSAAPAASKPRRNRPKHTAGAAPDAPTPLPHVGPSPAVIAQPGAQHHRTQPGRGRGRGRGGRGGSGNPAEPRWASNGGGRQMSTYAGGRHGAANSSAGEDVGARLALAPTPFARGGAGGGASRAGSWRSVHTDSSAAESAGARVPGPGPSRKGKKGKGKDADKAEKLLQEAALKEGEEGGLSTEIMRLYEVQRPSPAAIAARQHLIDELTMWLNEERFTWGHPHSPRVAPLKVVPFGSIRFGLSTAASDLDLCLLDPYRPNGFEEKHFSSKGPARPLPDIYNMYRIGASLKRANLTDVTSIADAAVPICKFKVLIDGHVIEADLNTNERLGVFNSRLINSYCNLHPLVRPLSVFVKFWAKQRGLNDPAGSPTTFSSYTYILLVISYMQHLDLLPNLQDADLIAQTGTPRQRFFSTPRARGGRGAGKRNKILPSVGWDVTFVEYDSPPEGYSPQEADLAQLARGFFHYWADEFDTERSIVSISNGRVPLARQRPFMRQEDIDREAAAARKALEEETGVEDAERVRQAAEDDAVAAFAEQAELEREEAVAPEALEAESGVEDAERVRQAPEGDAVAASAQQADDAAMQADGPALDAAIAELDAGRQAAAKGVGAGGPDSRSSSPVEYSDFEEPERWRENMLVVQDPFILTRNTAGNVRPDWVDELRVQMRRARDLIDASAPLSTICLAAVRDPDYNPIAWQRALAARADRLAKKDAKGAKRRPKAPRNASKAAAAVAEFEGAREGDAPLATGRGEERREISAPDDGAFEEVGRAVERLVADAAAEKSSS